MGPREASSDLPALRRGRRPGDRSAAVGLRGAPDAARHRAGGPGGRRRRAPATEPAPAEPTPPAAPAGPGRAPAPARARGGRAGGPAAPAAPAEPARPARRGAAAEDAKQKDKPVAARGRLHGRHDQRLQVHAQRRDGQRGRHRDLVEQRPDAHSATANDGSFDTGILSKGGSGSHTFTQAGTFSYICTPHPFMKGTVSRGRVVGRRRRDERRGHRLDRRHHRHRLAGRQRPLAPVDRDGRRRRWSCSAWRRSRSARYLRRRTAPEAARPAGPHRLVAAG